MELTPSQQKALATERHLAIMANAGSGKTRVLVKRYVDLFKCYRDLTTRNVVAITFTENAGSELRAKITEEVTEHLKLPTSLTPESRARLRALRDSLPSAYIGTIHGFAARLLREYPVEANIDAGFAILTGADQRMLIEDAIESAFYSELEEAYALPEENAALRLFRALGRRNVTDLVRALLGNRLRAANVRNNLLAKENADILAFWRSKLECILEIITAPETKRLLNQAASFLKSGKLGTEMQPAIESYLHASAFFDAARTFVNVVSKLMTDAGTLRKNVFDDKTLPSALQSDVLELIGRVNAIRPLLDVCPATETEFNAQHTEYLALLRSVFSLYDKVLTEYASTKAEYGLVDFDDLIVKLLGLLADARLREEIASEFRFLMIDEYQDTDESQLELARMLTANFGNMNNVAVVGDPKQAIYTFRNADAEVFNETLLAITAQTLSDAALKESIRLELLPEEEYGSIQLGESFRMTRTPLAAINRLFRIRDGSHSHSPLIQAREALLDGRVEWICPPAVKQGAVADDIINGTDSTEQEESSETDLIAKKILSIVHSDNTAYNVESKGELRIPSFGDIAILLRSRGALPTLERSLAAANIPYSVAKGSGFYAQQEILDIVSYLHFLTTPSNEVALAAILRSPFFALSDVELFQIANHESAKRRSAQDPWSFWQQFQSYAKMHSSNAPYLLRMLEQLQENLSLAGRIGTALLIQNIYAETGIFASLQAGPQPEQKIANLEKFLTQARTSDQSGFAGLFDFVERIRYLSDSEEQESQADVGGDNGAVRIMTIHAAKGLEFPIVILPFLQKQFNFDHQHLLDKELGLQIRLPDGRPPVFIAELIHRRAKASTIAEESRILYVAMTRARDHLILASTMQEKPKKDSWLAWICEAFGVPPNSGSLQMDETIVRYNKTSRTRETVAFHFEIPLIISFADIPEPSIPEIKDAAPFPSAFYLSPLEVFHPVSRFSATQLLRYKECPTKYHLSYVLGMPEEPKLAYDLEADEYSEQVQGTLLGQIVHKLMEKSDWLAPQLTLDEDHFKSEITSILDSLEIVNERERSNYSNTARRHLTTFLESPIAVRLQNASNSRVEFPLQTLLPTGDTLYGIIDRLFQDRDGTWTILDFKTGTYSTESTHNGYRFQLLFYAYLVHLMKPEAATVRGILFFTATGAITEYLFTNSDFSSFANVCLTMIEQIRMQENIPDLDLLHRNTDHCPECRFFEPDAKQCIVLAAQKPTHTPAI